MIRPLGPADAVAVARLSAQLGYPDVSEAVARARLAALDPAADAALGHETEAGALAAFIHARRTASLVDAPFALIAALVVDEAARGRGLGRELVAAVEGWARERGLAAVRVRSNVIRDRAHGFYEGLGYERKKTQHVFVKAITR